MNRASAFLCLRLCWRQTCNSRYCVLQTILTTLVPVSFSVFLGHLAGRKASAINDRALLTTLVIKWLLPSLLLAGVLETPRADLLNYKTPLIFLVGLMVPFLGVLLVYRFVLRHDRTTAILKADLLSFPIWFSWVSRFFTSCLGLRAYSRSWLRT